MSYYTNIELSYVVPIYIENEKSDAVTTLIKKYELYDEQIRKKIYFVFVDDCSPVKIKIETNKLNYILLRVTDNIKWNQGGARNLGVHHAKSSKLLLTDLDHHFSEKLLNYLINFKIPNNLYTFRREFQGKKINSAPNILFCTKSLFYKNLGVDEEFCGYYGYEDIYFRCLTRKLGVKIKKIRRFRVQNIEHKNNKEISHHFLDRDTTRNKKLLEKKLKYLKTKKPFQGHSRKHLQFNWEIIFEHIF